MMFRAGRNVNGPLGLLFLAVSLACSEPAGTDTPAARGQWVPLGLDGRWVNELLLEGDTLYASTDNGVYRAILRSANPAWASLGPAGDTIKAVMPLDGDTLLAAVDISGVPPDTLSLLRTTDGGGSWHSFQNGFGRGGGSNAVFAFAELAGAHGALLATNASMVARSDDRGASWRPIWGDWKGGGAGMHFINVDPRHPSLILAGGESGILSPLLVKSLDAGQTWEVFAPRTGGDDAIYRVAVDPTRVDVLYAGFENHLMRSTDGGRTWNDVLQKQVYFEGVATSRVSQARLYAAGRRFSVDGAAQPLVLHMSEDRGETWTQHTHEEQLGAVWDLVLHTDGVGEVAILGTTDGVFTFRLLEP